MNRIRMAGWAAAMVLAVGAGSMNAQMRDWKLDPSHSDADFAVKHMGISTVHGSFRGISGVIHLDPANLAHSAVEATIDVRTVDTGVEVRDTHLRSAEFFDVAKYPTMTFKSSSIAKSGSGYALTGDLTMHGVTKQVVLNMEAPDKEEVDAKGVAHRGFSATTTVNRRDFGLTYNGMLKSGDMTVGDDVKIELNVEVVNQ